MGPEDDRNPSQWAVIAYDSLIRPHTIVAPAANGHDAPPDFIVLQANRAAGEALRTDASALPGRRMAELLAELGVAELGADVRAAWVTGQIVDRKDFAVRVGPDQADTRYFNFRFTPIDGAVDCGWWDVTDDFQARQMQVSLDAAAIGMALVSANGRLMTVNPAMCRMLGYSKAELEGRTVADITHPDDLASGAQGIRAMVTGERDDFAQRKRYVAKSGEVIWGDLSAAVVRNPDGSFRHMVAQLVNVTAEVNSTAALRASVRRFRALAESASDLVIEIDSEGLIRWVSASVQRDLRWDPDLLIGMNIQSLIEPTDLEQARQKGRDLVQASGTSTHVVRLRRADGGTRSYEVRATRSTDAGPAPVIVAGFHDITERERDRLALERSERTFRLAMRWAPIGKAVADADGVFTAVNASLSRLLGVPEADIIGHRLEDFLPAKCQPAWEEMRRDLVAGGPGAAQHSHCLQGSGPEFWVEHSVALVPGDGDQPAQYIHQFVDRTEAIRLEQELKDLATRDGLTGLPNRLDLRTRLLERLGCESATAPRPTAVLFCDVDNLKQINDAHGHLVGDEVLTLVARRIDAALRSTDVVARFGGDEFVVVMDTDGAASTLELVAERIRGVVAQPVPMEQAAVQVSISIGATLSRPGETPGEVLDRADAALYQAKRAGRNRVAVIIPEPS